MAVILLSLILMVIFMSSCGTPGAQQIITKLVSIEPTNNATDVSTDIILKWDYPNPDELPLTFDIYFGEYNGSSSRNMNKVKTGWKQKEYKPEIELQRGKTYTWQVCVFSLARKLCDGPVLKFTTQNNPLPELIKVSGPSATTEASKCSFSWTGTDDGTITSYEYRKNNGSWSVNVPATETSYTWSDYDEGDHTFYVRGMDNEGKYSTEISWNFIYDLPNSSPTILKVSGPGSNVATDTSTFSWTGNDNGSSMRSISRYEYKKDNGSWINNDPITSTSYTWGGYSEGDHTFYVRAVDDEDADSNIISWTFNYTSVSKLTVQSSPTNGGEVRIDSGNWGTNENKSVNTGTQITIEANAYPGFSFDGWYDGATRISSQNPYTFTLNGNKIIKAQFNRFLDMVEVKSGIFVMGNKTDDFYASDSEKIVHEVELTYDYYIGKYEITNDIFLEFLNDAGVGSDGFLNGNRVICVEDSDCDFEYVSGAFSLKVPEKGKYPVIVVPWWGAVEFCNWLSEKNGLIRAFNVDGTLNDYPNNKGYRIPTEAEWEYAARGGHADISYDTANATVVENHDYKYVGGDNPDEVAWYSDNCGNCPYPIIEMFKKGVFSAGLKKPNELGVFDMNGNVAEWCYDWDGEYTDAKQMNPTGPATLTSSYKPKMYRCGSWRTDANYLILTRRNSASPGVWSYERGFRIVRSK